MSTHLHACLHINVFQQPTLAWFEIWLCDKMILTFTVSFIDTKKNNHTHFVVGNVKMSDHEENQTSAQDEEIVAKRSRATNAI